MKLSLKAITDFKAIYKNRFGIGLTDEEADDKGLELLEFFKHIYRKIPIENKAYLMTLNINYRV